VDDAIELDRIEPTHSPVIASEANPEPSLAPDCFSRALVEGAALLAVTSGRES
jgi:hypothetical protein